MRRSASSGPSSSTRRSSSSTATTRWPSWGASTWPASSPPTCSPRCSSGGGSCRTWSSRRATSPTTTGSRAATTATSAPPKFSTRPTAPATSGTWTACSTPTAGLLPIMRARVAQRFPQQAGDTDFVYRQAVKAKSLDALRGLLPAASLSNIGLYGTGQSYEQLLLRMRAHPLPEARSYADMMLTELRKVIPSFLQRVDVAERGGEWTGVSGVHARRHGAGGRAPLARVERVAASHRAARAARAARARGHLAGLRPRGGGESAGRGLFQSLALFRARGDTTGPYSSAMTNGSLCWRRTSGIGGTVATGRGAPSSGRTTASNW